MALEEDYERAMHYDVSKDGRGLGDCCGVDMVEKGPSNG